MEYRKFKDTGLKTSLLGMGCMRLPLIPGKGEAIDYEKAEEIIDYAYEHGVNYFDTAYVYNGGESEKVVGRALKKYPRDSFFLVTKMPGPLCENEDDVRRIFNEQLERCGVDYFDFYLCHNINEYSVDKFMAGYIIPVLEEYKTQGKIRFLGFSSHGSPELLEKFAKLRDWDFAQIQLNYFDWDFQDAKRQYEILTNLGIPVMVMEPVRGGRLASLCPEADKLMLDYAPDKSIASWALRFAASLPNVQVVLSGMSTMDQVIDNVNTFSNFQLLNEEEHRIIRQAVEILKAKTFLPCTGCRYCIECPMELPIPDLLSALNEYNLSPSPFALMRVFDMEEKKRPENCIECRQCVSRCPQGIDVPEALGQLAKLVRETPPPPR